MKTFTEFTQLSEETDLFGMVSDLLGPDIVDGVELSGKGPRFITLKLGSNQNRITWIRITLKPNKSFTVETLKMKNITPTVMKKVDNISPDNLKATFKQLIGRWTYGDWMNDDQK